MEELGVSGVSGHGVRTHLHNARSNKCMYIPHVIHPRTYMPSTFLLTVYTCTTGTITMYNVKVTLPATTILI